jgi:hypothetical protein
MALRLSSTVKVTEDSPDDAVRGPLKVGPSRPARSRQQQEEVLASFGAFIGLGTGVAIGSVVWVAAILLFRSLL